MAKGFEKVLMVKIQGLSMCRAGRQIMFPCIERALLFFFFLKKKSFRFFPVPNQDISLNRIRNRRCKKMYESHPQRNTSNQNFIRS